MTISIAALGEKVTHHIRNDESLKSLRYIIDGYNGDDWQTHVNFNEHTYHKESVYKNDVIEIIVISWNTNQKSKIHDHPDNGCLIKILRGCLSEEVYEKNDSEFDLVKRNELTTGMIGYQEGKHGLHKILNSDNKTISIHIYSPPNFVFRCY